MAPRFDGTPQAMLWSFDAANQGNQIRCPRGAAAEMIATKLDRKLRDHVLNSKDNLFSSQARSAPSAAGTPTSRPVLVILDRNVDLIPMLSHSWTYQSLCFDIFKVGSLVDDCRVSADHRNSRS